MRMLSVSDFSKETTLPEKLVRRMCLEGTIPALKIGKAWRINYDAACDILRNATFENMNKKQVSKAKRYSYPGTRMKTSDDFLRTLAAIGE